MSTTELQTIPPNDGGILAVIARAAADPNVDIGKFERLLALQTQVRAEQARTEFDAAMNAAQKELGRVVADKSNSQTSSKYASEAALDRAVRPSYTKHGFSLTFNTAPSTLENHVLVVCDVAHSGGHTKRFDLDMPADGKGARGNDVMTKTHATGSALSYGRRYLLKMIFNISIGDDDDGNAAGGIAYINEDQGKEVNRLIGEAGETIRAPFLKYMGGKEPLPTVMHILAKDYARAEKKLKEKVAEKKA